MLGHLSEDCNQPEKAVEFIRVALEGLITHDVHIWCADRKCASETREVARKDLPRFVFEPQVAEEMILVGELA